MLVVFYFNFICLRGGYFESSTVMVLICCYVCLLCFAVSLGDMILGG